MRPDGMDAMLARSTLVMGLTVAAIALPSAGSAQTSEDNQKQACMSDAFKFCVSSIPDRQAIGRCLVSNRDQLTPACRNVIDAGRAGRSKRS